MVIITYIVSDFGDKDEIELYGNDDVEIGNSQLDDLEIPIKALVKEVVNRFGYTITYRKVWLRSN
ncbi:hypothetical protein Lal_00001852 [Lupinus albus]|nr:hypothetical protein Lal_00001852 [Lupinus albus]